MTVYTSSGRPTQSWYGITVGIIILNVDIPYVPGNVGNATTYPFPVQFERVEEATLDRLINQRDESLSEGFIRAAKKLESQGVKAITGGCGFTALVQPQVAAAVSVPVFLSSLIQIPFMRQIINPGKKIGIVTADKTALTDRHFQNVGVDSSNTPMVIAGMQDKPEFVSAILEEKGALDSDKIRDELLSTVAGMLKANPDVGAILLECSDLPPYAHAVRTMTNLPVFDYVTMIHHVHNSLAMPAFQGYL